MSDLIATLQQYFQYPRFRPGQAEAIEHLLAGRDTLVVMPTGSGKSIIYQLAALSLPGTALIVSPLVALMKDQIDGLTRRKIAATFINSSVDAPEQRRRLAAMAAGQYKMVLVAPERFRSPAFQQVLAQTKISLFAVDEAHCLSQWGHDFRPDYLYLAEARRQLNPPVTVALTATATPRVQEDIINLLGLPQAERIITGFNRHNLALRVFNTRNPEAKQRRLDDFLGQSQGAGIIYAGTRRDTEELTQHLRHDLGLEVDYYHGALDAAARTKTQEAFLSGDLPLIVATNAFGMGIDRPDVRFVVHYSMPGSLEAYYQEAGRAGRDGLPAQALMLYSPRDTSLHQFFIENDAPSTYELRALHKFIKNTSNDLGWAEIEAATKLQQTKARVGLEQLEGIGALQRAEAPYGRLRLTAKPLNERDLVTVEKEVMTRRKHKYDLLSRMVDYSETSACRRVVLLKHFGDPERQEIAPADCCDNCAARARVPITIKRTVSTTTIAPTEIRTLSQAERAALIVLDALSKIGRPLGRGKVAQFLKGSVAADVVGFKDRPYYGKFNGLKLGEIESLIDQLLEAGYLKQVGAQYPTLALSPSGESALETKAAISVSLRPVASERVRRDDAAFSAAGTVTVTAELLGAGQSPEQIAAERGLTVSTIYSHLAALIAEGKVTLESVIPAKRQALILAAIEQVGSAETLSPIKLHLTEDISYGEIKCVAEFWKREHAKALAPAAQPLSDLPLMPLRRWRALVASQRNLPDYAILTDTVLRKIAQYRPQSVAALEALFVVDHDTLHNDGEAIVEIIQNSAQETLVIESILACVNDLPEQLPRSGIAKLLVGSASERMEEYQGHSLYNALAGYQRNDVLMQVDDLLERKLLEPGRSGNLRVARIPATPAAY